MKDLLGIPGLKGKPVFKSKAEHNAWRAKWTEEITPILNKLAKARRESEIEAMFHFVD